MELNQGVQLTIIPTSKFKTLAIKIVFKTQLTKEAITTRSLLSRLLERNSEEYPTTNKVEQALSLLYGAGYGTSVSRSGEAHAISFNMSLANERFLSDNTITDNAIEFLKSMIQKPNLSGNAFDAKTFAREKVNLKDDIESIYDNKQQYARVAMLKEYFTDEKQAISLKGDLKDLEALTAEDVYAAYEKMINEDSIEIFVLGDIDEAKITESMQSFNFQARTPQATDVFYHNELNELVEKEEVQDVKQAKLNLAYDTGIYFLEDDYFALQVFNGIFGGYPSSKLFMNVRERESLAYYASSSIDSTRGALFVQTGIDKNEASRVIDLIAEQLKDITLGDFEDETILQTKAMLKNSLRQSEDSPGQLISNAYSRQLVGSDITIDEWIEKIEAVTREEIIAISKRIELRTVFLLRGE